MMMADNTGYLLVADYFFLVFHTALIFFNLFGWVIRRWRIWHFVTITLTFASWVILGIWYGWGYCPFTDWHWQILRERGVGNLPDSYISYLIDRFLNLQFPDFWVDVMTVSFALIALGISVYVNFFGKKRRKSSNIQG